LLKEKKIVLTVAAFAILLIMLMGLLIIWFLIAAFAPTLLESFLNMLFIQTTLFALFIDVAIVIGIGIYFIKVYGPGLAWSNFENAIKAEDYNSAIEFCQKKILMYKRDKEAWINLANTYFLVGEIQKGESIFEKYLSDKPKYSILWKELGKNYLQVKEFNKAIESFNHYIKLNPYDFESFKLMAEMYYNTGDFQKALENIDKAIKLRSISKNLLELREQILSKINNKRI